MLCIGKTPVIFVLRRALKTASSLIQDAIRDSSAQRGSKI